MKFRNLSRALLLLAGSLGLTFGLTSCSADHTVGYIYVLGTQYNQIGEYQEDNNNGELTSIKGQPTASGGANPIRAVITGGSRFMYVLNAGTPATDPTTGNITYANSNIQLFSIGGYGQLYPQLSYSSQGFGSVRIALDSSSSHLFVLDEYAPVGITAGSTSSPTTSNTQSADYPCQDPQNPALFHPTGDVTVFAIDGATGRLELEQNQRQLNLNYFPVGCFPVDFSIANNTVYTMDAGSKTTNDLETLYVYALAGSGQLTPTQTTTIPITNNTGTPVNISAIYGSSGNLFLLDMLGDAVYSYAFGTNGALTPTDGSPYRPGTQAGGPVQATITTGGTQGYLYFADGGVPSGTFNPSGNSDVSGAVLNGTGGSLQLTAVQESPFTLTGTGTISGPVCIFEDPSNQYIYVAGALDNSITGRRIDPNTGVLSPLNKSYTFPTVGTPSWCLSISSVL